MAFMYTVAEALASAQTEIVIFVIAICAHALFFGGFKTIKSSSKKTPPKPRSRSSSPDPEKPSGPPPGIGGFQRVAGAAPTIVGPIIKQVRQKLKDGAGQEDFVDVLRKQLRGHSPRSTDEALVGVLEGVGRNESTLELLHAIRDLLRERGMQVSARLGEDLLRSFLYLKAPGDFQEVLVEVEAAYGSSPSVTALALRAAISASDLQGAFGCVRSLASTWRTLGVVAASPSAAPKGLMQQLIQLADKHGAMPVLIDELQQLGLLAPWSVEVILTECAKLADIASVAKCEALAHAQSLDFTPCALAALLHSTAAQAACAGKGTAVADSAVLEFFESKCTSEIDLLGTDTRSAGRLVAEAAVRMSRRDLLERLVASRDDPRKVALLKNLGASGKLAVAQEVFKVCPERSTCLHNALLDVCIDCGDLAAAERVMGEATKARVADVITYNTIIKAHLQSGSVRRARKAVETMKNAGLAPNCVTFNELLDASVHNDPEGTWAIIEEMKACGLKPTHVTCSILLKGIQRNSRAVDVERTMAVVDTLEVVDTGIPVTADSQGAIIDEVLLSSVCEACIRANRADLLVKHLHQYRGGPKTVHVQGAHSFGSLIRAYGFVQDLAGVWNTWKEMIKTKQIMPTSITLGCMVEALVTNNETEAGLGLIRDMMASEKTRSLVNAVIYCSVLKSFCHEKRFSRVWEIYEEMLQAKLQFSIVTYNALIDACARSGEMHRIEHFLAEMASQDIQPNIITHSTIIKGYCQENRLEQAFALLEDMKQNSSLRPDEVTYNTLLDGCARYGLYDRGIKVLHEMQEAGVPPTNFTLSVLVKLANRSKRPESAFQLCEDICRTYGFKPNMHVYNNLIQASTQLHDIPRALELLERMFHEKIRPDTRTYTLLLRGCIQSGDLEDAVGLVRAAMGLQGAHSRITGYGAQLVRPRGGLPSELLGEVVEAVAEKCTKNTLAMELVRDLSRMSGVKLDPKLQLRVTSRTIHPWRRSQERAVPVA